MTQTHAAAYGDGGWEFLMARTTAHAIEPLFLRRTSPRAMSGAALSTTTVELVFEAARWAPSGGNKQPWRFCYALRGTPDFDRFLAFLDDGNREWCVRAGALVVVWSATQDEKGRTIGATSLVTGCALMGALLQATALGIVAHAMGGFDADAAKTSLQLPTHAHPECMIALGLPGRVEDLSEKNRPREAPSDRKPLSEILFAGNAPSST